MLEYLILLSLYNPESDDKPSTVMPGGYRPPRGMTNMVSLIRWLRSELGEFCPFENDSEVQQQLLKLMNESEINLVEGILELTNSGKKKLLEHPVHKFMLKNMKPIFKAENAERAG